jgi:hypothetical protein
MATKSKKRKVIVTTERRGVFFGTLESYDEGTRVAVLADAAMAIYWGTTRGLFQLANTGPTEKSRISLPAPRIRLEVVECVIDVTGDAEAAWAQRMK